MESNLVYDYAAIGDGVGAISKFQQRMNEEVSGIESDVRNRLWPTMEGEARDAFEERKIKWDAAMGKIEGILGQLSAALAKGADDINVTDKHWANVFRG